MDLKDLLLLKDPSGILSVSMCPGRYAQVRIPPEVHFTRSILLICWYTMLRWEVLLVSKGKTVSPFILLLRDWRPRVYWLLYWYFLRLPSVFRDSQYKVFMTMGTSQSKFVQLIVKGWKLIKRKHPRTHTSWGRYLLVKQLGPQLIITLYFHN